MKIRTVIRTLLWSFLFVMFSSCGKKHQSLTSEITLANNQKSKNTNTIEELLANKNVIIEPKKFIQTYDGKNFYYNNHLDTVENIFLFKLQNPALTKKYSEIYQHSQLKELMSSAHENLKEIQQQASGWIYEYLNFLGANNFFHAKEWIKSTHQRFFQLLEAFPDFSQKFSTFLDQLDIANPPITLRSLENIFPDDASRRDQDYLENNIHKNLKILIITNSGFGGGHISVAGEIKLFLEKQGNTQSEIIDLAKFYEEEDVFYKVFGPGNNSQQIYNDYIGKENNFKKADKMWEIANNITEIISSTQIQRLEEYARKKSFDLIINTLHHMPQYINLSYVLKIPSLVITTDYALQEQLYPFLHLWTHPELVQVLIPTDEPHFFQHYKGKVHQAPAALQSSFNSYYQGHSTFDQYSDSVKVLKNLGGIPIRDVFSKSTNELVKELEKKISSKDIEQVVNIAQNKINHPASEKVIYFMMGKTSSKKLENIFDSIWENKAQFPLNTRTRLVFICGQNTELQNKFINFISKNPPPPSLQFNILGVLDGASIALLYKVGDLLITKPGGITTAEVIETGIPVAPIDPFDWEYINVEHLKKIGHPTVFISSHNDILPTIIDMHNGTNQLQRNTAVTSANKNLWSQNFIKILNTAYLNFRKI